MNNPTVLIYLFFLKYKLNHITQHTPTVYRVETQAFMFQSYLYEQTSFKWNRLFRVYESHAIDDEYGIVLANFKYHDFVDENQQITKVGELFLDNLLKKHPCFSDEFKHFLSNCQEKPFLEGTILENNIFSSVDDFIPVSLNYLFH